MASSPERGHLLVALMIGITVMSIMLTVAGEKWSTILRRDREEELVFRGKQYAQAIAEFQKEHKIPPRKLKDLLKKGPRGHRYIRQLFRDPFSKDGKWVLLRLVPGGQAVVNPATREMRPASMLQRAGLAGAPRPGQPIGPQTPEQFGLRGPRQSARFPGRGQRQATPPGRSLFRSAVTQISPYPPEQLLNQPIAGVASANLKERAFKKYEGYDRIRDFWFTVFEFAPVPQKGGGDAMVMPGGVGPGGRIRGSNPRQRGPRGFNRQRQRGPRGGGTGPSARPR